MSIAETIYEQEHRGRRFGPTWFAAVMIGFAIIKTARKLRHMKDPSQIDLEIV